ncbi:hypothetical protein VM98_26630 [Streptomyces rubellomurinus subsp. indigoferus]|nr:hypothetical protein VM98_26630 [Streptomyces rubellomurinus subsp. indigoferus]
MTDLNHTSGPAAPQWAQPGQNPAGTGAFGCCTTCPVRSGCGRRDDTAAFCAVTGHLPPPPPPAYPAGPDLMDEAAGRGMHDAVAGLLQPGWSHVAEAVISRSEAIHAADPTDWGRLQIGRNLLSVALATLVPVNGTTGAGWVAHAISTGGITHPVFGPAGAALCLVGSLGLGRYVPGLIGAVCGLGWSVLSAASTRLWRFVRSPRGWILTRPAIWAGACGVLTVFWRVIVHTLTGAHL